MALRTQLTTDTVERARAAAWRVAQTRCRTDPLTRMSAGDCDVIVAAALAQVDGEDMPPLAPEPPDWRDCPTCGGTGVDTQ